ncbi:histone-lysine N-methyltransferase, H3 lysine-9 specific SUVH6-like [Nicotiana tomentosiformis]|uniref:histone-lysine N-methyltransferase, H3 lysine-9 specific SUVH6-like n=1 Tax=Nicotiana tomentosiformis TaxID=4098 RepID=UPI00051C0497
MSVLTETSPSMMLGKRLHQSVYDEYPRCPSAFKRLKVDTTRNFPENCGPFVSQTTGSGIQCYGDAEIVPKFPSTTKRVKVGATRNFPQNCSPCVTQMDGIDTQCSAEAEIKSSSSVALEMSKSGKPLGVFVPNNLSGNPAIRPKDVQIDLPLTPWKAKKDDLVATGASLKEVDDSSNLRTLCEQLPPMNGNQPLKMKEFEGQNEPSNERSKRIHHEKVFDDESKTSVDDEICILSRLEWSSLKSSLKSRSTFKKDDKCEIVHTEKVKCLEPLGKCMINFEHAVNFEPSPKTVRSEQHNKLYKGEDFVSKDWDQNDFVVMKKQIVPRVSQKDLRTFTSLCDVYGQGLLTEYEDFQKANKVREALKLFDDLYTKLLREVKAKKCERKRSIHIEAAMSLKNQKKWVNYGWTFGHVPGVEIGDQFRFRAELVMVGLHRQFIRGIDYVNINRKDAAISIVDSGRYANETISSQTFIYVGQGGNPNISGTRVEDQKLEGGNLALKNSMDSGYPVRVIRSRQRVKDEKSDIRYIYDGLYTVTKYWQERGPTGKFVFKFELKRNFGQPKLTRELMSHPAYLDKVNYFLPNVNKATKSVMEREFVVDYDISQGKEKIPIPAVNAIDDERPPPFTYITKMQCPDWYYISMPQGCSCTSGCSDSEQCSCASKNGGEIPFNSRGAIIRAKPLVYECGPSCKCPPSCKNRVSQRGPRYHLEVFKTESRGWGLRSRDYVSSGSFICEYVGELLHEKEAEKRTDHDEYLFDVSNYDEEIPERNNKFEVESNCSQRKDEDGFTLDAARYGNVGRFINHSCSPNLYAQNVMYDHGDRRVPHIMFFASKSIVPLEELTYHYNYQIDQVYDANGNLKKKNCRCGSRKCSGRMY